MENTNKIEERKRRVQGMFNAIARRYDLLNHLLSGGIDFYWRRRALAAAGPQPLGRVLDLATGTCDFALGAARLRPKRIIGVDVALNMLRLGARKLAQDRRGALTRLLAGDAERLPFGDAHFDLVTVAFGVRNFGHIPTGLSEAWRVLSPGGTILILDFSQPSAPLFKQVFRFYFKHILPAVGGLVSGNRKAYAYLPDSVDGFPQGKAFLALLEGAGFCEACATSLTFGTCNIYQGRKPLAQGVGAVDEQAAV